MRHVLVLLAWLVLTVQACAGELTRADLERRFRPPLHVGEKLREVPAWPLTNELDPDAGPVGYAFESIDLAPLPGFEGTPINLLVAIDRYGAFIDVELLRQHEPVFLGGLGEAPLQEFLKQYAGKNLRQDFSIASPYGNARSAGESANRVVLDGVTRATASIRIVNQTVLTSALAVAHARLGFAAPDRKRPVAHPRTDAFEPLPPAELVRRGLIAHRIYRNADIERLFADTEAAGGDPEALAMPEATFVELYIAYLNAPTIGRALLGDADFDALMQGLEAGEQLYWIASAGRYRIVDEHFVPGTSPPRLSLTQAGLPLELRDHGVDSMQPPGFGDLDAARIFRVSAGAGLDPAQPLELALTITRAQGQILPRLTHRNAQITYALPASLFSYPALPAPEWLQAWRGRWPDLLIVGVALLALSLVLARPRRFASHPRRLKAFRLAFLAFTLLFLGWHAQGQLSVVHLTGALKSLLAGQSLANFLYDPVSLLVIVFTIISLFVWGRGTFCGWLCPFGALQEFVALGAAKIGCKPRRLSEALARRLAACRYGLLAVLVAAALFAPELAEGLVEAEPFKTAITVGFDRAWPYLAYAVAVLAISALYYKFFCRYLCPLGAALTLGGRLRRLDWLPRRAECGRPCQTCRHACDYDAIGRDGKVRYDECFQCLDCVVILDDPARCAPVVLQRRKGRRMPPGPPGASH